MFFILSFFGRKDRTEPVDFSQAAAVDNSIILYQNDSDWTSFSQCGKCYDLFSKHDKAAITIPCGHTFCKQCVEATTRRQTITCCDPLCKTAVGTDFYQKNLALTHLLEMLNLLNEPSNQHILGESDDDIIVLSTDDERLMEFGECCICLGKYAEGMHAPITTVCGHTFCSLCACQYGDQYRCPLCRTSFDRSVETHATDLTLIKILNKLQILDRSDDKVKKEEVQSTVSPLSCLVFFGLFASFSLIALRFSQSD